MSIYTRRGDAGETSLADGARVSKDSARVEAYGTIDEAGSALGLARVSVTDPQIAEVLRFVQQRLMNCASITATSVNAATPSKVTVSAEDVAALERSIDRLSERAGAWTGFVLETGSEAAARLHLARAITRRAERRMVGLSSHEPVNPAVLTFINRTSDVLYAAARVVNQCDECTEEPWDPEYRADL